MRNDPTIQPKSRQGQKNHFSGNMIVKLLRRNKNSSLSKTQNVPEDTFLCDVCKFILPLEYLCGVVIDDQYPEQSILCSVCAIWLGFEQPYFPQGLCYNFTDEQHDKIKALHKEIEATHECLASIAISDNYKVIHEFVDQVPNLNELLKLRLSLLPDEARDLSDSLTIGAIRNA